MAGGVVVRWSRDSLMSSRKALYLTGKGLSQCSRFQKWEVTIKDSVALMCAEVKIPAFTKGKPQLCPVDVETTRKIAHVRIHVERVIGLLRQKYAILSCTVPIHFVKTEGDGVTTLDKMVNVGCALINFCPSVVPLN